MYLTYMMCMKCNICLIVAIVYYELYIIANSYTYTKRTTNPVLKRDNFLIFPPCPPRLF